MAASVQIRALQKAVELAGGRRALAGRLGVKAADLEKWLGGRAELPREVFRFQRRNSFRVRTLPRSSPTMVLRHPGIPDMTLALRVLDVSTGGCALFLPNDVPPLSPGVISK